MSHAEAAVMFGFRAEAEVWDPHLRCQPTSRLYISLPASQALLWSAKRSRRHKSSDSFIDS